MRLARQHRKPGDVLLNMASMIDVVFLVLIFFMCTTGFRAPEKRLDAPLTEPVAKASAPRSDFEPIRIRLLSAAEGVAIKVNGASVADFRDLERRLNALRRLADVPVFIEAEDAVRFKHCVKVLDLCRKAAFTRVAFRA